ncbi:MAG: hypothetical protein GX130_01610 [Candidatus Hydrogenedens sp.]|jgi:hypothetical protein|nr:hypothetical protein [Candidatus Hydrogenedens sp.]
MSSQFLDIFEIIEHSLELFLQEFLQDPDLPSCKKNGMTLGDGREFVD